MGIFDKTVAGSLKFIPKPVIRRVARRYIAGERVEDAFDAVRKLSAEGCRATLDLLGESVRSEAEARASADTYLDLLDRIARDGVNASISIKPTHFGLLVDEALFLDNTRRVVARARELGNFVRIDMEDSPTTDATLRGYRALREEGFDNVGIVLQARLRRTPADFRDLAGLRPNVRLCKGVYLEPEAIAWQSYDEINRAYLDQLAYALGHGGFTMAIATHDDPVIEGAERLLAEHAVPRDRYEFQMLLGVRPEVRKALVERGHPLRVYVPFGQNWYAYCIRRLKENPQFAGHVTRDLLRDPGQLFGEADR